MFEEEDNLFKRLFVSDTNTRSPPQGSAALVSDTVVDEGEDAGLAGGGARGRHALGLAHGVPGV